MTEMVDVLVFSDLTGNLYLLPKAMLEAGRVPDGQREELGRLCGATSDDVQGYAHFGHVPSFSLLGQLGDTNSMRLQESLEQRSKAVETLSNVLQRQSATAATIVQNLK